MNRAPSSFHFRAANHDGSIATGRVAATSPADATELLTRRGLMPITITPESGATMRSGRRIAPAELAIGLRVMADLLASGLPVSRALNALEATAPEGWSAALPAVRDAVREGRSLASALEQSPLAIPPEVIGILHAGERGAGLAGAARAAAELSQHAADTRSAIRSALAYPLMLAVAGTLSAGLLIGVVLPRFAAILGDMGQSLPTSTRLVLGAGHAVRIAAVPVGLVLAAAMLAGRRYTQAPTGREAWHRFLLALPVIGDTREAIATARLCTTLAALLDAGVPVASALPHAARATGDEAIGLRVRAARQSVIEGERLSTAMAAQLAVTPVAARLMRAGEESGRLASLLAHAGSLERDRATRRVQGAVRIIEPALIVVFGGLVALISASLLQALYSVRPGA